MTPERMISFMSFPRGRSLLFENSRITAIAAAAIAILKNASMTGLIEKPAILVATTEDPQRIIDNVSIRYEPIQTKIPQNVQMRNETESFH